MHPKPDKPQPGQESVWNYPRPAIAEPVRCHIRILFGGEQIAVTKAAVRVLETSHPPTYYLPEAAFAEGVLQAVPGRSLCEWKGQAHYYDVAAGKTRAAKAAWGYRAPTRAFAALKDHVAIYPSQMDACYLEGELVIPQEGGFYGGWITSHVAGPFKGDSRYPGTNFW